MVGLAHGCAVTMQSIKFDDKSARVLATTCANQCSPQSGAHTLIQHVNVRVDQPTGQTIKQPTGQSTNRKHTLAQTHAHTHTSAPRYTNNRACDTCSPTNTLLQTHLHATPAKLILPCVQRQLADQIANASLCATNS